MGPTIEDAKPVLFHPAEKITGIAVAALFAVDFALVAARGIALDWPGYGVMVAIGLMALAAGQVYRLARPNERIALATTATGLFILLTIAGSVFCYLLLPMGRSIDQTLIAVDKLFGYHWPDFVAAAATVPYLGTVLRIVYLSSLAQMVAVIVVLGFSGRGGELHSFLVTGTLSALATILIWAAVPSFGPSANYPITPEIEAAVDLVVGSAYGAELNRLAAEGAILVSPKDGLGLIAFPSFHTVLTCLAVWFTASLRKLFPIFLTINIVMLPAILVHGGHHLVDVFGGFAVFALSLVIAERLLRPGRQVTLGPGAVTADQV